MTPRAFVLGVALVVGEVITFVISDQVQDHPLGQSRRLVENEPPLLDTRSQTAHVPTVRISDLPSKRSDCSTEPVDWRSHGMIWFQLAGIGHAT